MPPNRTVGGGILPFKASGTHSDVRVAGLPDAPGDVPVTEAVGAGESAADGVLDDDDVPPTLGVVVDPLGVGRAQVEAAVTGVGVALLPDRPRRRVEEDAAVGHSGRPVDGGVL